MATKEFVYSGFSYEEDVINIPILSNLMKKLHLIFPNMFLPLIIKHQFTIFLVSLILFFVFFFLQLMIKPEEVEFITEKDFFKIEAKSTKDKNKKELNYQKVSNIEDKLVRSRSKEKK